MDHAEALQVLKSRDRVVSGQRRLRALEADDANAHLALLDHRNIVCSIAHSQRGVPRRSLEHPHNRCFLQRRQSAQNRAVHELRNLQEELRHVVHDAAEGDAVDDDRDAVLASLRRVQRVRELLPNNVVPLSSGRCRGDINVLHKVLLRVNEFRRRADRHGGLALVPSQHPHNHTGLEEVADRFRDLVLELVLDRRHADETQLRLRLQAHLVDLMLAIRYGATGLEEALVPCIVLRLAHHTRPHDERAQPLHGHLPERGDDPVFDLQRPCVRVRQPRENIRVGPFRDNNNLTRGGVAQNERHHFPHGGELKRCEEFIFQRLSVHNNHNYVGPARCQLVAERRRRADERRLIRRLALVDELARVLFIREWLDCVAQRKGLEVAVDLRRAGHRRRLARELDRVPEHITAEEVHAVLCQRARLIREDVLDLAELLVEVRGIGLARVPFSIHELHQLMVPLHQARLRDFAQLNRHEERDGDHVAHQNKIRQISHEKEGNVRRVIVVDVVLDVPVVVVRFVELNGIATDGE
eukprot:PhM_4_TR2816/c0_g1_i1/m.94163